MIIGNVFFAVHTFPLFLTFFFQSCFRMFCVCLFFLEKKNLYEIPEDDKVELVGKCLDTSSTEFDWNFPFCPEILPTQSNFLKFPSIPQTNKLTFLFYLIILHIQNLNAFLRSRTFKLPRTGFCCFSLLDCIHSFLPRCILFPFFELCCLLFSKLIQNTPVTMEIYEKKINCKWKNMKKSKFTQTRTKVLNFRRLYFFIEFCW